MLQTRDLSAGERLFVDRRRRGETQAAAARAHNVTTYTYRQNELDRATDIATPTLGKLQPFEGCVIYRRRTGLTVDRFAELVRLSRWWVIQMERGNAPADALVAAWNDQPPALRKALNPRKTQR